MQPTLTLNCHKLVQNIKIRINVPCDECVCTQKISQSSGLSACLFLQSWIWAFEVSSLSQSYELQKLKWHFSVKKKHVLHWMDKTIYEAVFTREKKMMFWIFKDSGVLCTAYIARLMDACLVSCSHGCQQPCQFVFYFWTN